MHIHAYTTIFLLKMTINQELDLIFIKAASFFSVLAEPTRLKIMHVLCDGEQSVSRVMEEVNSSQSNVSRHLAAMCKVGVLSRRKEGLMVFYQIQDQQAVEFCRTICVGIASDVDVSDLVLPNNTNHQNRSKHVI